ncbi:STM4015 family protein [Catenulispora sp. NF23]|uniref:STM4015 family protein n=1 Tax=Catenulispora pinistramenti TaxID=2705254 RepID=UPI001BA848F2|nr:STM4015 family protein [Catenulispora pinistramenti]MBS2535738.1 STM4015 family protein [Catenulispora pinistramenti]
MNRDHTIEFAGLPVVSFPLDPDAPLPVAAEDGRPVAWRLECDVRWGAQFGHTLPELFDLFLRRVDAAGVEAVVFGVWSTEMDCGGHPVQVLVEAADRLAGLRRVFIADVGSEDIEVSWIANPPVTPLLESFPRLEELWVRGGPEDKDVPILAPIKHESLRTLVFQSGSLPSEAIRSIGQCSFPALERLEIYFGDPDYGGTGSADDIRSLLTGQGLSELRYLGLKNAMTQDAIATALAHAPIVAQLHTLDLSLGTLGDEGAAALLAGQPLGHLRKLDLHHHFLSQEMGDRLCHALPGVEIDLSERIAAEDRYVAVAE